MQFAAAHLPLWIIAWFTILAGTDSLAGRHTQEVLARAVCKARCLKKFAQDVSRLSATVSWCRERMEDSPGG